MKRIMRCICLTLVFAMVLSTGAIAADATKQNESETVSFLVDNYDEAQIAQDTYANLSPEAKQLFDQLLARNPRLAEYHRNNVDSSFRADLTDTYAVPKPNDPLELLAAELAALALPASVEYSLEAMGAGMVAAVADGPLPVGDILLAASTASAAIVVAANWNLVSSKWSRIINAFTTAFSTMVSNVRDAFGEIKDEIPNIQSAPPISINGQEVTIGGEKYNCRTDAEYFSKRDVKKDTYYVALRYLGAIWIDFDHPINKSKARFFIAANNSYVGIFASSESDARGVAGRYVGPEGCNHTSGYFLHYHNALHRRAHIWYFNG